MDYVEISVRISPRAAPTFGVVVESPEGVRESTLALPFRLADLAGLIFGVAQTARDMTPVDPAALMEAGAATAPAAPVPTAPVPAGASTSPDPQRTAKAFGEQLFEALFQGDVRSVFDMTTSAARARERGIRIRLSMDLQGDGMTDVASLPWELMRPRNQGPLVVSTQTLLVRSPDVVQPTEIRRFEPPLRILLVMSNPEGTAPLHLDEERARLAKIWGPLPDVTVDSCPPIVSALINKLRTADYHVIHYMGHGRFDPATGRGALVMMKEDGTRDLLSGEDLGVYLRDESRLLRLVFLNACKTGATGTREGVDPFAGIATSLIQTGVPAVVAMQFPISDEGAVAFSETFYQCVAKGDPVDVAMAESRKKLWHLNEWATPVLFLRSKDGVLFEPAVRTRDDSSARSEAGARTLPHHDDPWDDPWARVEGDADGPRVYVATACEALARAQKQLAKTLRDRRLRVIDTVPREDPAAHAALVRRVMRGADLSVHLLGDHPGAALDEAADAGSADDGASLGTYPMQELALGIEAAPSQLVLIPDTVDLDRLDDRAYAARLQQLVRMPRAARQFELVITDRNQFAAEIQAKLQRLADARPVAVSPAAAGVQTALVDLHHADLDSARDLLRHLSSRNIAWALTSSAGSPAEALSAFEAGLRTVPLYIVVFGSVAREWVNSRLDAALQRGAAADSLTRCIGVYLAPPVKTADETRFGRFYDVADNMAGFNAASIDALVERAAR